MSAIIVRQAENKDIPFLAKAVIEADKSGTHKSSYGSIFIMDEEQLTQAFETLFTYELEDCEFSVASFCICEFDGKLAGACAAWIENYNDVPSWQIKSSAMRYVISNEAKLNLLQLNSLVANFMPARTSGCLQIESVYVEPDFRGLGILGKMLSYQESFWKRRANPHSVEVMTYINNATAISGYEKYGFKKDRENIINDDNILNIYPSKGMVVLKK
jgi:ribosomal protein S18 acetylase RimI-like enzyme